MYGDKDKGKQTNWDPFLRHSSALGILKPDIVFDVFNMAANLPPPRVVRTGHSEDGKAVFAGDDLVSPVFPLGPRKNGFSVLDSRPSVPVDNTQAAERPENGVPRCAPGGVTFVISHIQPNFSSPMHRSLSMDYAVVLTGEIVLRLDSGEEKTLQAGECVVQHGTNHEWVNRTNEPVRLLFVMVGAEKITLENGRMLEETGSPGREE
jgi:quercetin dioxygenase-like cupin family protein